MAVILKKQKCRVCGKLKKFVPNTERDKQAVCGECWNW